MPQLSRPLALIMLALVATPATGGAQSLWPDSLRGTVEFGGEWIRPTMAQYDDAYPSDRGVWTVSARGRLRHDMQFVVALPTFVGAGDGVVAGGGNGNAYLGVLWLDAEGRPRLAVGYRPNMASRDEYFSPSIGEVADYDRTEASYRHVASANVALFHEAYRGENGTNIRFRLGSMLAFGGGDGVYGGNLLFDYGVRVGRDTPWLRAGLAFTGRYRLGTGDETVQGSSNYQGAVDFSFLPGPLRPYFGARFPLSKPLAESLDYALILGVTAVVR